MKKMLQSIYECINIIANPYKTLYPFQDIEADVDNGVVTFAPTKIKNITLSGENLLPIENDKHSVLIDAVSEVSFEIDIYKTIDWNNNNISAFEMAERLQTYLKSSYARESFFKNSYELMPIWSDIIFETDFNTYKKWVQIARYDLSIAKKSEVILASEKLEKINIEIKGINNL